MDRFTCCQMDILITASLAAWPNALSCQCQVYRWKVCVDSLVFHNTLVIELYMMQAGMHKKSIEASQKLKEEEERTGEDGLSRLMKDVDPAACSRSPRGEEDRRTESIAILRAKAQCYSARMLQSLAVTSQHGHVTDFCTSGFQSPSVTMVSTGC